MMVPFVPVHFKSNYHLLCIYSLCGDQLVFMHDLTSNLTGDTIFYIVSTTTGSLIIKFYGSFTIYTAEDLMVSKLKVQSAQSGCSDTSGDDPLVCYSGVTPGSTVVYYCANSSFERLSEESIRQCQSDGTWSGTTPSCVCNGKLSSVVTRHSCMLQGN